MTVVFSLAILLLAGAVVLLYAMMGELASRLPAEGGDTADSLRPLDNVRTGVAALDWPDGLAGFSTRSRAVVLVLSPICTTCDRVAAELADSRPGAADQSFGLVISTGDKARGEEFLNRHSLRPIPHLVDEGGAWVTGNFGVNQSPSALVFEEGVLTEAYTFGALTTVQNKLHIMAMEGSI